MGVGENALLTIVIMVAALGWVMNIVEIFTPASDPFTAMFVLRCVGVFIPPLGAILGYL